MAGWEIGLNHKRYGTQNYFELDLRYKQGTGAKNQLPAPEERWGEGTSRPKIINTFLQYQQPFEFKNQSFRYKIELSGQWNKTPLIQQDHFTIGGRYTIKGFDGELSLSGERGWLWKNELIWNNQVYFTLDSGRVIGSTTQSQLGKYLIGTSIGIRGEKNNFNYDFFIGTPIKKPHGFRSSKYTTGFNFSYNF